LIFYELEISKWYYSPISYTYHAAKLLQMAFYNEVLLI